MPRPSLSAVLYRLVDGLTLYLPVMVMGVLAMATYWLVRSTPTYTDPAPAAPVMHQPDYFMRGFAVKTYDKTGRLNREVRGAQALHFPDTQTLEIDRIILKTHAPDGTLTTATASHAVTDPEASEIQLIGHAQVVRTTAVRPDGRQPAVTTTTTMTGEFFHAYADTGRIVSHKPVTIIRGTDTLVADSMDFDYTRRILLLTGHVRGHGLPSAH